MTKLLACPALPAPAPALAPASAPALAPSLPTSLARALPLALALALAGTSTQAQPQYPPGFGPHPDLPEPVRALIPTVAVAPVARWKDDEHPVPAAGFQVQAYARGLDHPRWLYVLPNGDVLVAETNAPAKANAGHGVRGMITRHLMKKAGAGVASADRITLLRGLGADGTAAERTVFLDQLTSPFGMALAGNKLYVANTDAVLRFDYQEGQTSIATPGAKVLDLPAGPQNQHWARNLLAAPDGRTLYVSVGSSSNVGENGPQAETGRAAIWQFDIASGKARPYATGLRNPVGMDSEPHSGQLWTAVNERDELGDELVPDYMTAVRDGAFYGWPYSYFGAHVDARVSPARPDLVARAVAPDYALGAHTASLGLAFYRGQLFPPSYREGVFIGQHGSWNRRPPSGYKVIFVPFANGTPSGPPRDFLIGFLDRKGTAHGRPVGVAVARDGALLVADDVGNTVWRITPKAR
ncbi:sorbosone dehydrogenase family protein [Duganella sp. LX20W]|uniref:Sorbosone dehydrogenase family protein n=1 Tax=Rugamonas brunnea TaxID=2758569 RepID=A0A7W2EV32_9BURK|nr:sorbosone dehydrogenase family protein [Rugamonas brunnea]MBA5639124.1 sorbosone dehydrogenase family protein [Rugamonas brunnea]